MSDCVNQNAGLVPAVSVPQQTDGSGPGVRLFCVCSGSADLLILCWLSGWR